MSVNALININEHVQKDLRSDSVKNELTALRSYSEVTQHWNQMLSWATEIGCKSSNEHTQFSWFSTPVSNPFQRVLGVSAFLMPLLVMFLIYITILQV